MNIKATIKRLMLQAYGFLKRDKGGKIIYYHDVTDKYTSQGTPFELFKSHMDVIRKRGYKIVADIPVAEKEVMITFDDGWKGLWDHRQYFFDHKICPTVFLIVDYIGKEGYLTLDEILDLQAHGFRFQSHTYSHKNMTDVYGDELHHELVESREALSRLLNANVNEFCFPRGEYSDELIQRAISNGYEKVYICTPGNVVKSDKVLKRNLVQSVSPREFTAVLNGGLSVFSLHAEKLHHK